jgi:uncharacterized membrane protein
MSRIELLWSNLRSSFWFVPALTFAASVALALGLIELDSGQARPWIEQWPRVFGSRAAGARTMLSTIASSMMTVVGVTFSMTLVTLALASSQYTSRILRNCMADRITQVALGVFGGIFIYCLIVLRTIRGGDEDFVPSLAVFFGVVLAVGGIAILIYFIHHIATAIQASSIIESVAKETLASIDRQYPARDDGEERTAGNSAGLLAPVPEEGRRKVTSGRVGYIQSIDVTALIRLAHANDAAVHIERGVGEFVVRGATLATMNSRAALPESFPDEVEATFNIYRFRTIEQDVGFGIRQIVDIALRALSPSVNDTTTGVMCVDYLSAILAHLADRDFPAREHYCEGVLRVITTEQTFESLLSDAFDQIRGSARGNLSALARILEALRAVSAATRDAQRRNALADYASCMQEMRDSLLSAHERAQYDEILGNTPLADRR